MIDCKPFWTEDKDPKLETYYALRDEMRSGDTLEWRSKTLFGKLIRAITRRDVNHTSLLISLEEIEHCESRKFVMEAQGSGINFNVISTRLKDFDGDVYWLRLKNEYAQYRNDLKAFAFLNAGVKYDTAGLISNLWTRPLANKDKMFCSEFNFIAYKEVGIPKLKGLISAPRPGELFDLGIFYE